MVITEIGGTVGDIESLPFLEAARQVRHDVGRDNCFFLHVSLVPYLAPSGELKTKPTQHSVAALRSIGIQPDAVVCRSDREIPAERQAQDLADVRRRHRGGGVRGGRTAHLRHPEGAARRGPGRLRGAPARAAVPGRRLDACGATCSTGCTTRARTVTVALVGKYIDLPDAYLSVTEALRAGGFAHRAKVEIRWVPSDDCADPGRAPRPRWPAWTVC